MAYPLAKPRARPVTSAAAMGPTIDRERDEVAGSTDLAKSARDSVRRSIGFVGMVDKFDGDGSNDGSGTTDGAVSTSSYRSLARVRSSSSAARSGGALSTARSGALTVNSSGAIAGGINAGESRSARDVGCATAANADSVDGSAGSSGSTGSGSKASIAITLP